MLRRLFWSSALFVCTATPIICAQEESKPAEAPPSEVVGGYKQDKPSDRLRTSSAEAGKMFGSVQKMLRGDVTLAGQDAVLFDNYYNRFKLPMLTLADPESLKKLPDERLRFFRDHLEAASSLPVHNHLANLTLTYMVRVANENYHPAVRFNAMLMVGLLNDQETVRQGAQKQTPEPFTRAVQPLLDGFEKKGQLDLVRLAALIGLVRHLELDNFRQPNDKLPDAQRTEVVTLLTNLAKQKQAPAERSAGGHLWMRTRAVEGLGYSIYSKVSPATVAVLDELIGDSKEVLPIRFAAAQALARVKWDTWSGGQKYDVAASLSRLSDLLGDMVTQEKARLEQQRNQELEAVGPVGAAATGGTSGYSPPPSSMRRTEISGYDTPGLSVSTDRYGYRVEASRRRVRAWLHAVDLALKGVDFRNRPVNVQAVKGTVLATPSPLAGEPRGLASQAKAGPEMKALGALQKELDMLIAKMEVETDAVEDRATYEQELQAALDQMGKGAPANAPPPGGKEDDPLEATAAGNSAEPAKPAAAAVADPLEALEGK